MTQAYTMLKDSRLEPKAKAGTTVYAIRGYDYGLAKDDTRFRGIEHISVTLDSEGDYPFFTVPRADISVQTAGDDAGGKS